MLTFVGEGGEPAEAVLEGAEQGQGQTQVPTGRLQGEASSG